MRAIIYACSQCCTGGGAHESERLAVLTIVSMIHFFDGEDDAVMDDEEEGEVEPGAADEVADPATDDSE